MYDVSFITNKYSRNVLNWIKEMPLNSYFFLFIQNLDGYNATVIKHCLCYLKTKISGKDNPFVFIFLPSADCNRSLNVT